MKACLAGENPDAVMFASRINPNVLSDPLPLSGCVVAALDEELEPPVWPPAVVAGVRHGGCPTASVADARATSNRSAAASNQGADLAGEAPKEALAGPPLSLDGSPDFTGQCTILEPAVYVFDLSHVFALESFIERCCIHVKWRRQAHPDGTCCNLFNSCKAQGQIKSCPV